VVLKPFQNLIQLRLLDRIRVLHNPLNSLVRKVGGRRDQVLNQSAQSHDCGRDGSHREPIFCTGQGLSGAQVRLSEATPSRSFQPLRQRFRVRPSRFARAGPRRSCREWRPSVQRLGKEKATVQGCEACSSGAGIPLENGKRERLRRSNPDRLRMEALIYQCKQHRQGCLFQRSVERRVVFTNAAGYHLQN
jgi:hypothetical protein